MLLKGYVETIAFQRKIICAALFGWAATRQVEICELKFVKGLTNYQIAMQLNVSVKTVDKELNTAYKQITNVLSFL